MVSEHASPLAALGGVDAGGQNVHVAALSGALVELGHEVRVYTRRDNANLPDQVLTPAGYTVVHVPAGPPEPIPKDELLPYMREFGLWLQNQWRTWRPDVAHAHFWMSGLATHVGARDHNIPVIITFHALGTVKKRYQGSADTSPPARIRIERSLAISSDRVIATSVDEVGELIHMGMNRRQAVVVPCGVDVKQFDRVGPVSPRTKNFRILSAGRLVPRKGIATIIQALARIPNAELLIAGGPAQDNLVHDAEANRLADIAQHVNVADRVFFLGAVPQSQLPAVYRSADVVVCVPWYEPFGIVPLEAMACGRPVIASAVGGLVDTVVDGVTGVLVPPRRPDVLANEIRKLMLNPFERQAMGMAATDRACNRYTWDRIAAETAHIYEEEIAKAQGPVSAFNELAEQEVQR